MVPFPTPARLALLNTSTSTAAAASTKEDAECGQRASYTGRRRTLPRTAQLTCRSSYGIIRFPKSTLTSPHFSGNCRRTMRWLSTYSISLEIMPPCVWSASLGCPHARRTSAHLWGHGRSTPGHTPWPQSHLLLVLLGPRRPTSSVHVSSVSTTRAGHGHNPGYSFLSPVTNLWLPLSGSVRSYLPSL